MVIQLLVHRAEVTAHQAAEEVLAVIHRVLAVLHPSNMVLHLREEASVDSLRRSNTVLHQLHPSSTVLLLAEADSEAVLRLHLNNTVLQATATEMVTVPADTVLLGMILGFRRSFG